MDSLQASRICGGNTAYKRNASDYYPTPWDVTQALLDYIHIPTGAKVWEPACGEGHMVRVLEANGLKVTGTDIATGTDFLTAEMPQGTEWIITNPPFSLAEEFIEAALRHNRPVAMLLKSQFWHARKRYDLFLNHKPAHVLPLTWRPDFLFRERGKGSPLMDVLWCVWNGAPLFTQYVPLRRPVLKGANYE